MIRRVRRKRPSAGSVVALVALVAALTGTAAAGPGVHSAVSKQQTKKIAATDADAVDGS